MPVCWLLSAWQPSHNAMPLRRCFDVLTLILTLNHCDNTAVAFRRCFDVISWACSRPIANQQTRQFHVSVLTTRRLHWVEWTQCNIRSNRSAMCNRCFPGPTRVLNANPISVAPEFSAGLTRWHTDRPRYSVIRNRRHLPT